MNTSELLEDQSRGTPHGAMELDTMSDNDEGTCPICLCQFDDTDDVTWSLNKHCKHVFHRECSGEWLQNKEDCPVCRSFFLHLMMRRLALLM